jgi:hypothetical protein
MSHLFVRLEPSIKNTILCKDGRPVFYFLFIYFFVVGLGFKLRTS